MQQRKLSVAVLGGNEDITRIMRKQFETEGFQVVEASLGNIKRGNIDLVDFITTHDPSVIVYELAAPFITSWSFYRLVRENTAMKNRNFLLYTTNKEALEAASVTQEEVYEVTEEDDVNALIEAAGQWTGRGKEQDLETQPARRLSQAG